mmetsp:Transcript_20584/g.57216  ORF Transcript_20584/g.57216 Transcript_20584/m.57216 type:complete len:630 (+) Transcript_20584:84-1973(+)
MGAAESSSCCTNAAANPSGATLQVSDSDVPKAAARKPSRTASESRVCMMNDIDGTVCGENDHLALGHLLKWMDATSCLAAEKHCGRCAVTLVMDDLDIAADSESLLRRGQICVLEGKVTRAFGSSMEVVVSVSVADFASGTLRSFCSAYFMYVVLKTEEEKHTGAKIEVPGLFPQTPEEHLEHSLAEKRKVFRTQREKRIQEICDRAASAKPGACSADILGGVPVASVDFTELVLPFHANHMGNTFGGQIMAWMAKSASAAVWLHLRRCGHTQVPGLPNSDLLRESVRLQLVAIDQIHFKRPSHVGDRVQIRAVLTRVFESSLEVLVQVSSASVASQDAPTEINVGYLTYAVYEGESPLKCRIPDVRPDTVEQQVEHCKAAARQQFRLQRRETVRRDDPASSGLSVEFNADSGHAEELAVLCVSGILRIKDSTELRWEALLGAGNGVSAFVDVGPKIPGAQTRLKLSGKVCCRPRDCYDMLRDLSRRKDWDPTCMEVNRLGAVGNDAELVRMLHAAPQAEAGNAMGAPRDVLLLRAWREDEGTGSFIIASRSVLDDSTPPSPDMERGQLLPTGYIIVESPGSSGTSTELTFVGQFDHATFELARPHAVQVFRDFKNMMEKEVATPAVST